MIACLERGGSFVACQLLIPIVNSQEGNERGPKVQGEVHETRLSVNPIRDSTFTSAVTIFDGDIHSFPTRELGVSMLKLG